MEIFFIFQSTSSELETNLWLILLFHGIFLLLLCFNIINFLSNLQCEEPPYIFIDIFIRYNCRDVNLLFTLHYKMVAECPVLRDGFLILPFSFAIHLDCLSWITSLPRALQLSSRCYCRITSSVIHQHKLINENVPLRFS